MLSTHPTCGLLLQLWQEVILLIVQVVLRVLAAAGQDSKGRSSIKLSGMGTQLVTCCNPLCAGGQQTIAACMRRQPLEQR